MGVSHAKDLREERFIEFVGFLYEKHPECFEYCHCTWTEKYTGEDGVFAVLVRTLMWNEKESKKVFENEFKAYQRVRSRFLDTDPESFDDWVNEIIHDIKFGADGEGAHRDNRHKQYTGRAIHEYLELMGDSQDRFLRSANSFDTLFTNVKKIFSIGRLTAFDFLERLYRSKHKHISVYPLKYYRTGGGAEKGLMMIYPRLENGELEKKGTELLQRILDRTSINREIAFFEIESILCICQKRERCKDLEKMLSGEIATETFAESYARMNCLGQTKRRERCR